MAGELGDRDTRAEAGPRPLSTSQLPEGHGPVFTQDLPANADSVFRGEPSASARSSIFGSEPSPVLTNEPPDDPSVFKSEPSEDTRAGSKSELADGPRSAFKSDLPEGPRPRRGAPEQTRARLIQTAAQIFNEVPYWETDSNQLAKAAGYSTGTFYRHFKDKREIFIAAYREWVVEEWNSIESRMSPALTPGESIDRASDALIEHHRRWRVFRGNLRALVTYDEELRELTQSLRLEQLEKMRLLRRMRGDPPRALERDAIHALMFERICDALADGDFRSLGCCAEQAQAEFRTMMRSYLFEP